MPTCESQSQPTTFAATRTPGLCSCLASLRGNAVCLTLTRAQLQNWKRPAIASTRKVLVPSALAGPHSILELHSLPQQALLHCSCLASSGCSTVYLTLASAQLQNSKRPAIAPTRKVPAPKAFAGSHCPLEPHSPPHRDSRSALVSFVRVQHCVSHSRRAQLRNSNSRCLCRSAAVSRKNLLITRT